MEPSENQPDPMAELEKTFNRIQSRATALNSNLRSALSSVRRSRNSADDTFTVTLTDTERAPLVEMIQDSEKVIQSFSNTQLSNRDRLLLATQMLITEAMATLLEVELSETFAEMRPMFLGQNES